MPHRPEQQAQPQKVAEVVSQFEQLQPLFMPLYEIALVQLIWEIRVYYASSISKGGELERNGRVNSFMSSSSIDFSHHRSASSPPITSSGKRKRTTRAGFPTTTA